MRITHGFADFPSDKFYDILTQQRQSVSPFKLSEQNVEKFTAMGRFSKKKLQKIETLNLVCMYADRSKSYLTVDIPPLKEVWSESRDPFPIFWCPSHITGTAEARVVKFSIQIRYAKFYSTDKKTPTW